MVPEWLREHQAHEYPDADLIAKELEASGERLGRQSEIEVLYGEPTSISSLVRAMSHRSPVLYAVSNIAAGVLARLVWEPPREKAYRVIFVVRFIAAGSKQRTAGRSEAVVHSPSAPYRPDVHQDGVEVVQDHSCLGPSPIK